MPTTDQSLFVSYSIKPDGSLPANTFTFSLTPAGGSSRAFTCSLHNRDDAEVVNMVAVGTTVTSSPNGLDAFPGNSLTIHLNYDSSGRDDIVIPLVFHDDLSVALNQQTIQLMWSAQKLEVTSPARPLIELDPQGSPIVLSYDVPEPTSYRGRHVIELGIDQDCFKTAPTDDPPTLETRSASPGGGFISGGPTYGNETPLVGDQAPVGRKSATQLNDDTIRSAFVKAKTTGYFDPSVFPNVQIGNDTYTRMCVMESLAALSEETVVTQLQAGNRLTLYRDTSGRCMYRFIPTPTQGVPMLVLVEYYRLSSFPARYGAGRTIKTFSLLPGEKTRIRVSTYKRSSESLQQSTSIIDSTSAETESEFERTVLSEQSNKDNINKSFEYHAEAEAEAKASWGWGSADVSVSGGVKGSSNAAREEFAKNISNAVAHNAARASSRRDVQVDTSLDVKLETGEEQAIERDLENINVSRTLNFVFRQMNQEFVSLLHLVDVRVAFFNGYAESRVEVPLPELDTLLNSFINEDKVGTVRQAIADELRSLIDYRGEPQPEFIQEVTLSGGSNPSYMRVNPDAVAFYRAGSDGPTIHVPGIILSADSHVMRTDGVVVDAFLGLGNGLDDYSIGLQTQEVRKRELENKRQQAETERLRLALQIIQQGDATRAGLYQQLFPTPQIVNQIEQAAINPQTNGQPTNVPTTT